MSADPLRVVSLFAGAGGIDEGTAQACEELRLEPGVDVELHAINHWEPAIQTHEANHQWAEHYHARIEELYPADVVEPGTVTLLTAGPECTHFSNARGGKPVSDQKRASAWHVLDWIEKLRPEHVLLENVKEFRAWGPIDDEGEPSKDGSIFERWVAVIESLGYSVVYDDEDQDYGVVLNAADYGDPQSRERLFILASRSTLPTPPPKTHSDDPDDDLPPRRPAADIIDWSDLGESLWTRDLENPRVTPLSPNIMARIAEGIRRHCPGLPSVFADAIERIGPDELERLREHVVPAAAAPYVAELVDGPFLVRAGGSVGTASPFITRYYGTNHSSAVGDPVGTITAGGNKYGLTSPSPYLLGQHTGSTPRDVASQPLPTVTTTSRGISLCSPSPFVLGQHSNSVARDVDARPAPTVTSDGNIHLATPEAFCLRQQSGGVPVPVSDPLSTVAGGGAIGMATVESRALLQPRNGQYGEPAIAYDPFDRPIHTVIAGDPRQGHLLTPSLVRYSHGGAALRSDAPMPTIATEKGGTFALSQPYLCPLYNTFSASERPRTRSVDRPLMTVTARKPAPACLASPFIHQLTHGGRVFDPDNPLPTITAAHRGEHALASPYLCPLYPERVDQRPRTRSVDRPLMAVPASKSPAAVASPFLVEYYGNGRSSPVADPVPTVTTKDRFALCVPEAFPWGLDVRYRMLQPDELKQAQGFPPDYELAGSTKETRTKLIGNAVPVNLAKSLVGHLLADETPSLSTYGGGLIEDPDAEVPAYAEVSQGHD